MQSLDWVSRNGVNMEGVCVNHFGETYSCSIIQWMQRMFSPFSVIPYLLSLYFLLISAALAEKIYQSSNQKTK
ncbi:MAG: hypothetical protein GF334_06680 [Candidatus Altiarchaeales archaeon]|nr:hypothetical protein [Candidatus Altiarchaeales archaeon]